MYLRLVNGSPEKYSIEQLKASDPQVSFPNPAPDDLLASYDIYPFYVGGQPQFDDLVQDVVEGPFEQDASGLWAVTWIVENLPLAVAESNVRRRRDELLAQSDWVVIKATEAGGPIPPDWIAYRQALRDVTSQAGFPYNVVWPAKPE